eukprot:TRINITY_DN197_c0_g1_i1.p1 TRINITY_DN197_c0_g1~~TRINITY_DN197_c0_g1_i1.p1  ORF type:complete len:349 (-),score=111.52 TRINITY_DN197_c0_g1_i1:60-1106(-)
MENNIKLNSLSVIEKDNNSDVLLTWAHPSVNEEMERVLISKTGFLDDDSPINQFIFTKYSDKWIYIFNTVVSSNNQLPQLQAFSICLTTSDYWPEKYFALVKIMASLYEKEGTPIKVLEVFLSVYTKGKYKSGELEYVDSSFDIRRTYLGGSLTDLINIFGEKVVLIWTAMMLKKRIVVYGDDIVTLLKIVRTLPILVWHRQSWDQLRPFVNFSNLEIEDLKSSGVFVAGFLKPHIKSQSEFYDLFIDIPNSSITFTEQAKQDFQQAKYHTDLANFLVTSTKSEGYNEQNLIKELTGKTKELIGKLDMLKVEVDGKKLITLEALKERKLPPNMDTFLFGVAQSEGFTK